MKQYSELDRKEKDRIALLFTAWLKPYTKSVIMSVMSKRDEIINNEFAMKLLDELFHRQEKESRSFEMSICSLLDDYETFKEYDPHSHPLDHSNSYRDILHDMYIG